jgi:hypothetical protein
LDFGVGFVSLAEKFEILPTMAIIDTISGHHGRTATVVIFLIRPVYLDAPINKVMGSTEEEWKTVTRDDKKRVMRKRGRRGPAKGSAVEHRSTTTTAMASIEDSEVMYSTITKCMEHLRSACFFESMLKAWSNATGSAPEKTVSQIVCYGVGNFSQTSLSHYSAPLWQLACALCFRDHLLRSSDGEDIRVLYYEPFMTAFEDTILAGLKVQVLTVNERAKRPIDAVPTLFFMPHCPSQLYDNVLWSNWDELAVSTPLIICGNSLRNHCESLAPASACPCLHLSLPWLQEQRLESSVSDLKQSPGNFMGAFNDTYLTHFQVQALGQTLWPERPCETTESGQEII